jgi:uncharacterized protein (DUF2336 family)
MAVPASPLPELEDVIQAGTPERRAQMLERLTTLFLDGADRFTEDHVGLFDNVLSRLVIEIEAKARAELSYRLAAVGNAPLQVVRALAKDDDIAVAGPMLAQSRRLADSDLVDIAGTKSQAHLLAICYRSGIAEPVTNILVRRGDSDVIRGVARNRGAQLSHTSFSKLVTRAEQDDDLAETVGMRADLPPQLFRELMLKATAVVRERLLASAAPEMQAEIQRVLANISDDVGSRAARRDFTAAQRRTQELRQEGKLNEAQLVAFAKAGQYEETVASLALLCSVPIEVVDRLMSGDRPDPVLILGKSAGWGWATVRAIIMARSGDKPASSHGLDTAFANFERLSPATAQRVMRFWQARPASAGAIP